jgi:hypothetical protein
MPCFHHPIEQRNLRRELPNSSVRLPVMATGVRENESASLIDLGGGAGAAFVVDRIHVTRYSHGRGRYSHWI